MRIRTDEMHVAARFIRIGFKLAGSSGDPWRRRRHRCGLADHAGVSDSKRQDRLDPSQGCDLVGKRLRIGQPRSGERRCIGRQNPHVEPRPIEQLAKGHDQSARQQQHVEQQRSDGRHTGDAE